MCLKFLKRIFCKSYIEEIEKLKRNWIKQNSRIVLNFFRQNKKLTTAETAKLLGKSRSYAAKILNYLEKQNKIKETGKKGKNTVYEMV